MVYFKKVDIFKAEGEFVVTKAFKSEGRLFQVGDAFPWQKINLTPRRLRQLYYANFVEYKAEFERVVKKREKVKPTNGKKPIDKKPADKEKGDAPKAKADKTPKSEGGKKKSTNGKKPVK